MLELLESIYSRVNIKAKVTADILGANAKVIVATQLFFSVPIAIFNTFWALYLIELGASKDFPGLLASAFLTLQVLVNILAAFVTGRFGHKRTYLVVSFLCWPLALIFYAFSGSILLASLALIVNSLFMLADASFIFLFVKGIRSRKTHSAFAVLSVIFTSASFFVPLAGWVIKRYGMLDGGRMVFLGGAFLMSISIFIRAFLLEDVREKRGGGRDLSKYLSSIKSFFRNKILLRVMLMDSLMVFNLTILGVYASVYMNDKTGLDLSGETIANFPMFYAVAVIVSSLLVVPRLDIKNVKKHLGLSILSGLIGWLVFLIAPPGGYFYVVAAFLLHGVCFGVYFPVLMSIILRNMRYGEKTIIYSLVNISALITSIPAGLIAGKLYLISPRMPFYLVVVVFMLSLLTAVFLVPNAISVNKNIKSSF